MIFAEAVTFDPGLVVALFVGFLLVCAAVVAVAVTGIVAGYRHGRDPANTRAATAWRVCLGIEAAVVALILIAGAPAQLTLAALVAAGVTTLAHAVGRHTT